MRLITEANGQLGDDFQRLFDEIKIEYIATDCKELDITRIGDIKKFVIGKKMPYWQDAIVRFLEGLNDEN